MSKAILLSIKPKYVAEILNGNKTIEIRKTYPKCELPIDVYIYCTNDSKKLVYHNLADGGRTFTYGKEFSYHENDLNGKVVAKFTLKKVKKIPYFKEIDYPDGYEDFDGVWHDRTKTYNDVHWISHGDCEKTCLSYEILHEYLGKKDGYAWYIEDLVVFDEPKSLTWIRGTKQGIDFVGKPYYKFLKRPPQSYCYIEL